MTRHFTCAALAALSLVPVLAAKPARAQQALPPALLANDIALTELAARHPLSAQERAQVVAIDQAQFRREPAWSLQTLRRGATDVKNARRLNPVGLADWRKANLVAVLLHSSPHLTPEEDKILLAIYTRTNPIVAVYPDLKTVITEKDIDGWAAATRLTAQKSGVPLSGSRSTLAGYARDAKYPAMVHTRVGNMERNWAAYQLCWKHEPAGEQRQMMAKQVKMVRQFAAKGDGFSAAAGTALNLTDAAFVDYPYSLSPSFAVLKPRIIAQGLGAMQMEMALRHNQDMMNMMGWTLREQGRMLRNQSQVGGPPASGDEMAEPMPLPSPYAPNNRPN